MSFALAAAGTGGHVYPALAVADALVAAGVDRSDIVFFGGDRIETEVVPAAGFEFIGVEIRGLHRSLSPANLGLPFVVWRAVKRMRRELQTHRVTVVAVFGGYISIPAALAARRTGAAVVVHEQNARPGLANRLIAPFATETLAAFRPALNRLARARVVGNPLRPALAGFDRDTLRVDARKRYGLVESGPVLGVLGGSLGAGVLNESVARVAADPGLEGLSILHLTGAEHADSMAELARRSSASWVTAAYEQEMKWFFAATDLVLSRSGALTVSELAATGTPSILVPLEATHQGENAGVLALHGGARVIAQSDIGQVPSEVRRLMGDGALREKMSRAARSVSVPGAAAEMAAVLLELARG